MNTQIVPERDFHTYGIFDNTSIYLKFKVFEDEDNILR